MKTITYMDNKYSHSNKFKRKERGKRKTKRNEVESLQNLQSPLESPSKPPNPSKELPPRVPKESLGRKDSFNVPFFTLYTSNPSF